MSEIKHTPLPWGIAHWPEHRIIFKDHVPTTKQAEKVICKMRNVDNDQDNLIRKANAEFIVRACNSHYELVEAVELAYTVLKATGWVAEKNDWVQQALNKANKSLCDVNIINNNLED